ncbi:unnamed protein product [Rotaria socialis]
MNFAAYSNSTSQCKESYTERQAKLGRPVSPHVEIYKFPPAALSSITNRITGVALSTGLTSIAAVALLGGDAASLMTCVGDSAVGSVAKFAVAFPFVFHYFGGVRHILWDKNPDMLTSEEVQKTSYILLGVSVAASVGLAVVSI